MNGYHQESEQYCWPTAGDNSGGMTLDKINNFSHCDRITDKTLPIVFPMKKVLSEAAALLYDIRRPILCTHRSS